MSLQNVVASTVSFVDPNHRYTREIPDLLYRPRVMVSSAMGLKLKVFGFVPTTHAKNKRKTNASTIFVCRAAFYACLSLCSDSSRRRWHTLLKNQDYFDYGKTQRPPIWAPYRDKNGACSGISLVYLWSKQM